MVVNRKCTSKITDRIHARQIGSDFGHMYLGFMGPEAMSQSGYSTFLHAFSKWHQTEIPLPNLDLDGLTDVLNLNWLDDIHGQI